MRLHVMTFRPLLISSAMCAGLMCFPSAASAQDDAAFKAGIDARNAKKWQEAAQNMRRAIQMNPQEGTRKAATGLFGRGGTEYLPHFFLGEALFNLQDCAGAVDEWGKSEQQGAVRSRADFMGIIQSGYAACEAKGVLPPAKYDPLFARTTQHVTDVSNQALAVNKLATSNTEFWQGDGRQQYERAAAEINAARARLEAATKSHAAGDFAEATAAADRGRALLVTLEASLNSAIYARLSIQGQQRDIEQVLASADGYDKAIEAKRALLTPALSSARQQGRDAMSRAKDRLTEGVKASSAATLSDSRTIAQDATTRLKQVADELTRIEHEAMLHQLADAAARGHETFSLVDGAFANYERLANVRSNAVGPDVPARKDAIQRDVAAARRRFEAAVRTESLNGVVEATRLASISVGKLNELISTFGPLTLADRGVHPALIEGARLFFAGQYEQALSALTPAEGFAPDIPLQLQIHLFRAAAAYTLFLRSGETNQMLREQTLAEIKECKQIDSGFEPDRRVFTPRFISVFRSGTVAGGTPATAAGSKQ
jgi:hypothetical protein